MNKQTPPRRQPRSEYIARITERYYKMAGKKDSKRMRACIKETLKPPTPPPLAKKAPRKKTPPTALPKQA